MSNPFIVRRRSAWVVSGLLLLFAIVALRWLTAQAEPDAKSVEWVRTIFAREWGVPHPEGIAYSEERNRFFVIEKNPSEAASGQSTVVVLTPYEDLIGSARFNFNIGDTINLAFDDQAGRLLLLTGAPRQLIEIKAAADGQLDPASERRYDAARFGLINPEGLAVDHRGKYLFILDRANSNVIRIDLRAPLDSAGFERFSLASLGRSDLRGIAFNHETHHLFVMSPSKKMLYEYTEDFKYLAQYDIAPLKLRDPLALVFAYSADRTDDANTVHLFIADSKLPPELAADEGSEVVVSERAYLPAIFQSDDYVMQEEPIDEPNDEPIAPETDGAAIAADTVFGQIVEVSLDTDNSGPGAAITAASINLQPLTLVQTIQTSAFSPASPDPSGITYVPTTGLLIESDAEVEEMPALYQSVNLFGFRPQFVSAPSTVVTLKTRTTRFTNEPADIAFNPNNGHYFYSDDDTKRIIEVTVGGDGLVGTADDTSTNFSTALFGCMDPEGLDYDEVNNVLWIADGLNREVYRITPAGSLLSQFDSNILGILDPEGIDYDPASGNLFITGRSTTVIYEVSTGGALIDTYDIAAAGALKPAGIVLAPGSLNPAQMNFWIVDRGIDNDEVPTENDGKMYEFSRSTVPVPTPTVTNTPTPTPVPTPLPPALIYLGASANGTVTNNNGTTLGFEAKDILSYDTRTGNYAIYFDGSAVGLPATSNVQAFERDGADILFSLQASANLPGGLAVQSIDIVRYSPATNSFSLYFDGSDQNLRLDRAGSIDAFTIVAPNQLVISFAGRADLPNGQRVEDEDLALFRATSLGNLTTGSWSVYFDGSDVGLADGLENEDVYGVWRDANGELYLTTRGAFAVPGLTGDGSDIFICQGNTPGGTSTCTYRMFWDGQTRGFGNNIVDSFAVQFQ